MFYIANKAAKILVDDAKLQEEEDWIIKNHNLIQEELKARKKMLKGGWQTDDSLHFSNLRPLETEPQLNNQLNEDGQDKALNEEYNIYNMKSVKDGLEGLLDNISEDQIYKILVSFRSVHIDDSTKEDKSTFHSSHPIIFGNPSIHPYKLLFTFFR